MAEVADFHLSLDIFDQDEDDDLPTLTQPILSSWPDHFPSHPDPFSLHPPLHIFHPEQEEEDEVIHEPQDHTTSIHILDSDSNSNSDSSDHLNLVSDLFHDEFSSNPFAEEPFFRVVDDEDEDGIGNNYLELGIDRNENVEHGFMIEDSSESHFRVTELGESPFGLQVIDIESELDEDEEIDFRDDEEEDGFGREGEDDDLDIPLCWDCLRLEDQRESIGEFEWEEVDGGGERADERDVLSMVIDEDIDISVAAEFHSAEVVEGREEIIRNLEWEVLLAVNNIERNHDLELEPGIDHEEYIYPAEYEMVFGQFAENDNALRGSPPAAKSVVENLPFIVLTQEDVQNKNALCAVCKDEISTEEQAKLLPCSHYYHGDCILPWLNIRNTCPVCRFELPTDDPEYERRRT